MNNFLVTGAAGFIGSHLVDRLLADGHVVVGFDNFDPFYPRAIKKANIAGALKNKNFTLVEKDVCAPLDELDSAINAATGGARVDAIVHLAAKAGVRPSIADPVGYRKANLGGGQNMLELAKKLGTRQFVFGSSSSVYGVNPNVPWKEDESVIKPISPYASNKVSDELLGHVYSHLYGIRFIALRLFTVYGPRQRPDLAIYKFAKLILEGKPIPVFGDGSTRRDYTYVDDIVSGIVAAVGYKQTDYEVINLGNDHTVRLSELIETLESVLGRKATVDRKSEQPGDVPQTWADISKARALLDYHPATALTDGIGMMIKSLAPADAFLSGDGS